MKNLTGQLCLFTVLLLNTFTNIAQPTWPSNASVILDYADPGGGMGIGINKRISMDMFSHYAFGQSTITPNEHLIVCAFDDIPSGSSISQVRLTFWDVGANNWRTMPAISNATQPDVVLLDDPNNPGVDYYAALVYEQGGNIMLRYYEIQGVGSSTLTVTPSTAQQVNLNVVVCDNPHIDAAPHITQTVTSPPLSSPLYRMVHFAITWHESSTTSGDEIWTGFDDDFNGNNSAAGVMNVRKVDDGIISDVAFARVQDNAASQNYHKAYYIYENAGSIYNADIADVYAILPASSINTYPAIESIISKSPPRIDAGNYQMLQSSNDDRWEAVIAARNSGSPFNQEIHTYWKPGSSVNITNYSDAAFMASNPLTGENAYHPTVATGSNNLSWTAGAAFAGNADYMMGFLFDDPNIGDDHFLAVTQNGVGLTPQMGYDEVNNNGVSVSTLTTNNEPALALSYGTNTGYGSTAAFSDGASVYIKKTNDYLTTSPLFKPTAVADIKVGSELSVYPNPATSYIGLSGVDGECTYAITDVLGKQHAAGSMGNTMKPIDISTLPAGMYMVTVSQEADIKYLKFVKQ